MSTMMRSLCVGFVATFSLLVTPSICNAGPIHDGIKAGNLNEVVHLLDSGTNVNERVENDEYCTFTPLHMAVWEDKIEIARELIKRGADVKALDQAGRNPLFGAAYKGNAEMIHLLLDNGAKDIMNNGSFFEGSVVDMETPLGIAMSYYHKNAARVLIMNGADVNKGNDHGSTPLHSAATGGFVDMVQLLIEHGANVNAEEPGSHWTPLQAAATMGHKDVMGILISHGADGNVRNWTGKTAADMLEEHNKTQEYLKSHK